MPLSLEKVRKGFDVLASIGLIILALVLITLLVFAILVCLGVLTDGAIPIVIAVLAGVSLLIASFVGVYITAMIIVNWVKSCCCCNFSKEEPGNLIKEVPFLDGGRKSSDADTKTATSSDEEEGELTKEELKAKVLASRKTSTPVKQLIIQQDGEFNYYSLYAVRKRKAHKDGKEGKEEKEVGNEEVVLDDGQEVIPAMGNLVATPKKDTPKKDF